VLKAEHALRSFTVSFPVKNNWKNFCCLQPAHFPEVKYLHQRADSRAAEEMTAAYSPSG